MRGLAFALAGALAWVGLVETSGPWSIGFAALLGFVAQRLFLAPGSAATGRRAPLRRAGAMLRLAGRFGLDLVVANIQQLRIVLAPRVRVEPHWLLYRTSLKDPRLRVLLGILISLTPGTVTAELRRDQLIVHVLDSSDPQRVAAGIRERFEVLLEEFDR
jgi:multisubunit Na+/H+ antiporter MnhE subunit